MRYNVDGNNGTVREVPRGDRYRVETATYVRLRQSRIAHGADGKRHGSH